MPRFAIALVACLCAGLVSAGAQEVSTEAACIAALQRAVDRLAAIESGMASAKRACVAAENAVLQAEVARLREANAAAMEKVRELTKESGDLKNTNTGLSGQLASAETGLTAERERANRLDQRVSALQSENASLRGDGGEQRKRLGETQARLRHLLEQIDAALAPRIRAALSGPFATCETPPEISVHEGAVSVRGRLLNVQDAKQRIAEIIRSVPGAAAQTDGLTKLDVCGQPLGEGWIVETDSAGLRRVGYREISAEAIGKLPEGTAEMCRTLGERLDRMQGATIRRPFWVRRPGSRLLAYCQPEGGAWAYYQEQINRVEGLVLQRSQ